MEKMKPCEEEHHSVEVPCECTAVGYFRRKPDADLFLAEHPKVGKIIIKRIPDITAVHARLTPSAKIKNLRQISQEILLLQHIQKVAHIVDLELVYLSRNGEDLHVVTKFSGNTLQEEVRSHGGMSEDRTRLITTQVLLAFSAIHASGFVHRDPSDSNIVVRQDSVATFAGTGKSRPVDDSVAKHFEEPDAMLPFRAPEVILGAQYTQAADVWSIGCLAAEMIIGGRLFRAKDPVTALSSIFHIIGLPQRDECTSVGVANSGHVVVDRMRNECQKLGKPEPVHRSFRSFTKGMFEVSDNFEDWIGSILVFSPSARPTVNALLRHQWIQTDPTCKALVNSFFAATHVEPCRPKVGDEEHELLQFIRESCTDVETKLVIVNPPLMKQPSFS